MSVNKANETVYASNLGSPNTRNSLKADIAENRQATALENFETSKNWQSFKKRALSISRFGRLPEFRL